MNWKRYLFPFSHQEPRPSDRYAGYHERVLATTIDVVCLYTAFNHAFSWLRWQMYGDVLPDVPEAYGADVSWPELYRLLVESGFLSYVLLEVAIEVAVLGGVLALSQYCLKTTPGRWLVGLRLADAKTEADPTPAQLIRRFLGYFISLPPLMLGYIWCAWDGKRQSWHDKVAGTVVLNMRPSGWYWEQIKRLYRKYRGTASQ